MNEETEETMAEYLESCLSAAEWNVRQKEELLLKAWRRINYLEGREAELVGRLSDAVQGAKITPADLSCSAGKGGVKMNEYEFQHNMVGAKSLGKFSKRPESDFWAGYQRGLRRLYHGEKFGTPKGHILWMGLADDRDESRQMRGLGYRFGFAGHDIAAAIKMLKERRRPAA